MDAQTPEDSSPPTPHSSREKIIEALKIVSQAQSEDPALIHSLKESLLAPRPKGWGPNSVVVYYNAKCAEELRPFLDTLYNDKGEFLYDKEVFFSRTNYKSPKSFKTRIYNSWKYLIDTEPEGSIYSRIKESTEVRKEAGGIAIRWKLNLRRIRNEGTARLNSMDNSPLQATIVEPQDLSTPWRSELLRFFETATEDRNLYKKHNLSLDETDHNWIKKLLKDSGDEFHLLELTTNKIMIAYSKELAEETARAERIPVV